MVENFSGWDKRDWKYCWKKNDFNRCADITSTKNHKTVPKVDGKFIQISKLTKKDEPALLSSLLIG